MTEIYRSQNYNVLRITGAYVRALSLRMGGFKVFETATCNRPGSKFHGCAGMGPTLREYITNGDEFPAEFRERLRTERTTLKWKA